MLPVAAQITVDQSDMPSPGDTIRKSIALNFDAFDFTETGTDHTWDYTGLLPLAQTVDTFVRVTDTPIGYWPFFLLSANLANPVIDSPFPQLPLEDVFRFFNNSSDDYRDVGFAATVFSIPLPFNFENDDIIYQFPMNYGNVDSSESGFQRSIPGIGYLLVDRKRVNEVDGWGTLRTPFGTFEVLRIKSEVYEYDSLYIDTLDLGIPINQNYTEYKWIAESQKIPILSATENLLGVMVEYVDSVRDLNVITPEFSFSDEFGLKVYPNPVSNKLKVYFFANKFAEFSFEVYGMDGKQYLVATKSFSKLGDIVHTIDLGSYGLKPGKYVLRLVSPQKNESALFIYTGR